MTNVKTTMSKKKAIPKMATQKHKKKQPQKLKRQQRYAIIKDGGAEVHKRAPGSASAAAVLGPGEAPRVPTVADGPVATRALDAARSQLVV
mgnify:CR=1 FL=1